MDIEIFKIKALQQNNTSTVNSNAHPEIVKITCSS